MREALQTSSPLVATGRKGLRAIRVDVDQLLGIEHIRREDWRKAVVEIARRLDVCFAQHFADHLARDAQAHVVDGDGAFFTEIHPPVSFDLRGCEALRKRRAPLTFHLNSSIGVAEIRGRPRPQRVFARPLNLPE